EELREDEIGQYLIRHTLAVEVADEHDAKRATQQTRHHRRGNQAEQPRWRERDMCHHRKEHDGYALRQRHQTLARDFAKDNGVARDRRDENLLAKVVLTILDQRDDALAGGLKKR